MHVLVYSNTCKDGTTIAKLVADILSDEGININDLGYHVRHNFYRRVDNAVRSLSRSKMLVIERTYKPSTIQPHLIIKRNP